MKTSLLALVFLTGMSVLPGAFAEGPGAGGGTVVYVGNGPDSSSDVLVDFAPSQNEIAINPRTYEGIYSRLEPKLARLDYYFPGLRADLESVFKKQWKMTSQYFRADSPNELKPIAQNQDFVKITYGWFKTATAKQKEQSWMHEMVRNYVESHTKSAGMLRAYLKSDPNFLASVDKIIFTITPLFFNEEPIDRVQWEWTKAFRDNYIYPYLNPLRGDDQEDRFASTRSTMYGTITLGKLIERYQSFCDPAVIGDRYQLAALVQSFPRIRDQYYAAEHLKLYPNRTEMLKSFYGISSEWQIAGGPNNGIIYTSAPMNAVSRFALRTSAALEGDATYGSFEFRPPNAGTKDLRLTLEGRMQALKAACTEQGPELPKIFAEYQRDGGHMQDRAKTAPEADESDVQKFFSRRQNP